MAGSTGFELGTRGIKADTAVIMDRTKRRLESLANIVSGGLKGKEGVKEWVGGRGWIWSTASLELYK